MKKVSIIVPIHNVEEYLSRCLDSILSQTYENFELICVNDNSKDESASILEQYKKFDNRVVVYNNEFNCVAKTRNFGIDKASGEYIMFVDSDDYISSNMVEKLVECIEETNADVVVSDYFAKNFRTDLSNAKFAYKAQLDHSLINSNVVKVDQNNEYNFLNFAVTCWNKIYSTKFLKTKNVTFPPMCPIYEDVVFWARVYLNADTIYYTPNAYYYYRKRRKGSLMAKRDENTFFVVDIHKLMAEEFKKHNLYDKMKTFLDYIMIRDYMVKMFQSNPDYKKRLYNSIKASKPNVNIEDMEKLNLSEESKLYLEYYKIFTNESFEDFCLKTKEHVLIDA